MKVQVLDGPALRLEWSETPWDTRLFGSTVLQISRIDVRTQQASLAFAEFERQRDASDCHFVCCRLGCEQLTASMFLEARGFRYIETVYTPQLEFKEPSLPSSEPPLQVRRATAETLPEFLAIAGRAFRNERFHVDPRLHPATGDLRYANWVASSLDHPVQELHGLWSEHQLVGFFVIEMQSDGTCYWHLNAIAQEAQGQGYGRRAWLAMISVAQQRGAVRIRSSIVARNVRVLNLYAQLGFRFTLPQTTLHWVSEKLPVH